MAWSSSGEFLAVGSFDNSARLLNSFTWRNVAEYPHPRTASSTNGVFVYEEITIVDNPSGRVGEAAGAQVGVQGGAMSGYKLSSRPVRLPAGHPTQKSKNGAPKKGVHDISWSADNNFIATMERVVADDSLDLGNSDAALAQCPCPAIASQIHAMASSAK